MMLNTKNIFPTYLCTSMGCGCAMSKVEIFVPNAHVVYTLWIIALYSVANVSACTIHRAAVQ